MSMRRLWAVLLVATGLPWASRASEPSARRPNVVLIMTDNHGAWTLGCYGNRDIRTPHIDRLAREGTLMTHAFASNPVCSPTRATFLTGLMPSQHGVHCFLTAGRLQMGPDARGTLQEFTSLPEVLRDAGYACGLVGKWHLGDNLNPQEGFEDYWITMPHGGTSTFYDARVIEDGQVRTEPRYLTDLWTEHAIGFIEQQAKQDEPFFLFLAYNGPYSLGRLLLREGHNRHAEHYANQALPSFPRGPAHPWQFNNLDYHNNPVSIRRVATEISGIDDGVGTVMETLRRQGIDRDTLIVFVADQGWVGGQGGFFGMGDHTRPVTARDGMMRIPMIWRHRGKIASGRRSDLMASNYDLMPTVLGHLGLGDRMPSAPQSPGVDFSDALAKDGSGPPVSATVQRDAVFYEFESLRCIRTRNWKYVHRHPNGPHELYHLASDPEEFTNLVDFPKHAATRERLRRRLATFFQTHSLPRYDLYRGGGSQTKRFVGIDEETAQRPATPRPPLPEKFQPAELNLPDGFTAELVAGPPLVTHPTLGCLDDSGRLFICNNSGENLSAEQLEQQRPNSIRMLEDRDGDGRYEHATVFADRMTYPMGGVWHEGSLYVASPPHIWRLQDTDDDGVADVRERLVSEFGYTGNAASIHGCFFGPDGRLYWCDGYHGHKLTDGAGQVTSERNGSYLFSCRPDGSDVRIHCGGGMDNPVEVDFTERGDLVGTVNILYSRPRVDALVHWLHGGLYPHRRQVLDELQSTGQWLGPLHRFGHVAVSGLTRYRSGVMDHRWRDDFFATFFNSGKVVRLDVTPSGSSYEVVQREFLSCDSRDFHPTDVIEDADGSLLVVDTGGWFYRGCPTSQMSKPDVLGGIYRIRRRGMTPPVVPRGSEIVWDELSENELVRRFNDTRHTVRQRAVSEAARRGVAIVPALARASRRDLPVRRNAVWALTRILGESPDLPAARQAARSFLEDRDATVRAAACHCLATSPDADARDGLIERLDDEDAGVRRKAAAALGRLGDPAAVKPLLQSLRKRAPVDAAEEHALLFALIEIGAEGPLSEVLTDRSRRVSNTAIDAGLARVLRACVLTLHQLAPAALGNASLVSQLDAGDAALRETALQILTERAARRRGTQDLPAALHPASEWIAQQLRRAVSGEPSQQTLGDMGLTGAAVTAFASGPQVAATVAEILDDASAPSALQIELLEALAEADSVTMRPPWRGPLESLLRQGDAERKRAAVSAAVALGGFEAALREISRDQGQSGEVRIAALRGAESATGSGLSPAAMDIVVGMLRQTGTEDADRAANLIGSASLSSGQLRQLAPFLSDAGPAALRNLIRPYARRLTARGAEAFLEHLDGARSLATLPPTELSDVIKRFPPETLPRGNRLLDRLRQADQQRREKVDRLLAALPEAEPRRGRELFFGERSKCGTCHRVGQQGGTVGPDLSTIGSNRSVNDLLESIVFPSASIVRQYESTTVLTSEGQVLHGIVIEESADRLSLQQPTGEPLMLSKSEIERTAPSAVSIMPKGLDRLLSERDLVDLVAWLSRLGD